MNVVQMSKGAFTYLPFLFSRRFNIKPFNNVIITAILQYELSDFTDEIQYTMGVNPPEWE